MLVRKIVRANGVRAPKVPRGEALVVSLYRDDRAKVVLVNPEDLAMLEDSYALLESVGRLEPLPIDELTYKTRAVEDTPDEESIEDYDQIAAILAL